MKNKILIVSGDPNSINSELIFKAWKKINNSQKKRIYLIANFDLIRKQFQKLNLKINLVKLKKVDEKLDKNTQKKLKIVDIDLKFKKPFKVNKSSASKFVINSLNLAHQLSLKKNILGFINCAIDKTLLGNKKIGVTEFLSSKCNVKKDTEVMLIKTKSFSVCPITTHVDVKEVSKKLNINLIKKKVETIHNYYKKYLMKKPKIGILGLNPHNAELRKNSEENSIIIPAIKKLKNQNIKVYGPLVSDTIFMQNYKYYDVIVGMYHDQVLSPFKALYKFNAINLTLGLKYLRVSPDHGTAVDLIGKNKSSPVSLLKCINFLDSLKK